MNAASSRQHVALLRYITPPGQGFLPKQTAVHHQVSVTDWASRTHSQQLVHCRLSANEMIARWPSPWLLVCLQEHIIQLVQEALQEASVKPEQIDCIAYTKVPHLQQSWAAVADCGNTCASYATDGAPCSVTACHRRGRAWVGRW